MVHILFVCTGNICRSPIAQGIFESIARREGMDGEVEADSAGTHGYYHVGEPPDGRALESVPARDIDVFGRRARLLDPEDCRRFDNVPTMDEENYRAVSTICKGSAVVRPFPDFVHKRHRSGRA